MNPPQDNLKKKIEPKIDIEGINIKKLKKEDINFYFEMLPWQRDSFRKYIKEAKSETLKKVFEDVRGIILWARQWAEYVDDQEVLDKWDRGVSLIRDYNFETENNFDLKIFWEAQKLKELETK